jgi:hypothetical protein
MTKPFEETYVGRMCTTDAAVSQTVVLTRALWLLLSGECSLREGADRDAVIGLTRELVDYTREIEDAIADERQTLKTERPRVGAELPAEGAAP